MSGDLGAGSDASLDDWLTRDQVLAGLPARRAGSLLFLIESRTAHLVAESSEAMVPVHWEEGGREREHAFLEAFALGRDPPVRPTIRDIERNASDWADLVPEGAETRAALALQLAEKYRLPARFIPGIRSAIGLDDPRVRAAYASAYGRPIDSIYAQRIGPAEFLGWTGTRLTTWLETLPAFWTAFALTLTETVGTSVLALPIALARVGPLGGVVLLIAIGLVNVLTIAALAETVARNASVRYSGAYFGRVVAEYLGAAGSLILSVALSVICVVSLLAFYLGVSHTLHDATSFPAGMWSAVLFAVTLYFLSRRLRATVAAALVVGAATIGFLLLFSAIALLHSQPAQLLHSNVWTGQPVDPAAVRWALGVILLGYFGHLSIGNCARIVLHHDPSARALIWGAVVAQLTAIGLYCLWVIAINGAVAANSLEHAPGTALSPLALVAGPSVLVLGGIYVVLSMGMASVHMSLSLRNLIRERLPSPSPEASYDDHQVAQADPKGLIGRLRSMASPSHARTLLSTSPLVVIFVAAEWIVLTGAESFTGLISLAGILAASVVAGLFPMLLVTASEQKSDFLLRVAQLLPRNRVFRGGIYLLFMAGLLLHGLVLWEGPARLAALTMAVLVLGATVRMWRQGAFAGRLVVRIQQDAAQGGKVVFAVIRAGRPQPARLELEYVDGTRVIEATEGEVPTFSELRSLTFEIRPGDAHDLKVWVNRVTATGDLAPLPAVVDASSGKGPRRLDLAQSGGQALLPIEGTICRVIVRFPSQLSPSRTRGSAFLAI